jgi:hypothetical protein
MIPVGTPSRRGINREAQEPTPLVEEGEEEGATEAMQAGAAATPPSPWEQVRGALVPGGMEAAGCLEGEVSCPREAVHTGGE